MYKCAECGYEGIDFKIVSGNDPAITAWTTRKCPQCGHVDMYDEVKEKEKAQERVKELCAQIKEYLAQKEFDEAFQLWEEAVELNSYAELKEEGDFLSGLANDARKWKRNLAANLFSSLESGPKKWKRGFKRRKPL